MFDCKPIFLTVMQYWSQVHILTEETGIETETCENRGQWYNTDMQKVPWKHRTGNNEFFMRKHHRGGKFDLALEEWLFCWCYRNNAESKSLGIDTIHLLVKSLFIHVFIWNLPKKSLFHTKHFISLTTIKISFYWWSCYGENSCDR